MKIKFPIIVKMALLGILVSGIATGAALTISTINQRIRSEEMLIQNIDKSLYSVEFNYTSGNDKDALLEQLETVKDYIKTVYTDPTVHDTTLADFENFGEYEEYFKSKAPWIFPNPTSMIGSQAYFDFRSAYREMSHIILEAFLSSDVRAAYICYQDKVSDDETRFVFMNDSRMQQNNTQDPFYHLPGSHYVLKDTDKVIDTSNEEYYGYELSGYLTRFVPIKKGEETVAHVFLEYDRGAIIAQSNSILVKELMFFSIALVFTVLLYMLLSYLIIARNLNKLTKATDSISKDLKENKNITPKKFNFKSHDEISSLASSFEVMEEEIVNYVNIIKQEAKENERRKAELAVANNIQISALPENTFKDENLFLLAYIKPAKTVGGDFYDYFYQKDEFIVLVSDVSGKGIPAALFMMKAKTLIKSKIASGLSLVDAIRDVNNELVKNNDELLFVTSFIGSINFKKGIMKYINAGHEKPYILHGNEVIKVEGPSNFVLGGEENIEYEEGSIAFEKGDSILLFTDGLNESINHAEEEFGYDRIVDTLKKCEGLSNRDILALFNKELKEFVGEEEQFDDITMIVLNSLDNSLKLHYDKKDFSIIDDAVDKFSDKFSFLDEEIVSKVGICLDEMLNNLISYEKKEDLIIDLDFSYKNDDLTVVISSNGNDYNPFENKKEKHFSGEEEDLAPGGFGVILVESSAKEYSYAYKNNQSIVTLKF